MVRTWQRAPLTVLGRVLSDIGGPWGGTAIVAVLAVVLLLRGRIWGPSSWRSPTAAALAHPS